MIGSQGSLLAMTDLFVSASAALLMVLAVSKPFEPKPLPIQADLLAGCGVEGPSQDKMVAFFRTAQANAEQKVEVRQPSELSAMPAALGLVPKPYYLVTVVPDSTGTISGACYDFIAKQLATTANSELDRIPHSHVTPRAVFIVSLPNYEPRDEI